MSIVLVPFGQALFDSTQDAGGTLYEYVNSYIKWASGIAFRRYSSSLESDRI